MWPLLEETVPPSRALDRALLNLFCTKHAVVNYIYKTIFMVFRELISLIYSSSVSAFNRFVREEASSD